MVIPSPAGPAGPSLCLDHGGQPQERHQVPGGPPLVLAATMLMSLSFLCDRDRAPLPPPLPPPSAAQMGRLTHFRLPDTSSWTQPQFEDRDLLVACGRAPRWQLMGRWLVAGGVGSMGAP